MLRLESLPLAVVLGLLAMGDLAPIRAAKPSDQLLPATTKGYLSVPDVDALRERWNATQLGKMVNDPVMKPFVEDLVQQIRTRLSRTEVRLGIAWSDLEGVYGGEVTVAVVQPWDAQQAEAEVAAAVERTVLAGVSAGKSSDELEVLRRTEEASAREEQERRRSAQRALVMLVDVTGRVSEANALLEKVSLDLRARGGTPSSVTIEGVEVVKHTLPAETAAGSAREVYLVIHEDQLLATDHAGVATELLRRLNGTVEGGLQRHPAFQQAMQRTAEELGEVAPHIRWFIEPFGYVEVARAYDEGPRRRRTDLLRVLKNQGFDAVQGLGGQLAFSTSGYEILHRTFIYAPSQPQPGAAPGERYRLAANMLRFPNTAALDPQDWVPSAVSSYLSFQWKMRDAFEYAKTLVDELVGSEGVFEDVLNSIEADPNGAQINIRKELIAHLAERGTLLSDYRLPIDTKSERLLFAIELTDPAAVMQTVNKAMEYEPLARRREHAGHVIWEILNEDPEEVETINIQGGFAFPFENEPEPVEEEKPRIPNSAITVAYGQLLVASHVDYIVEILEQPAGQRLGDAADYKRVSQALRTLGAGEDAFSFFSRTDEAYRPTYELLQQGKMPEAETLFGKLLNRLWESGEEGQLRTQFLDGSKMPAYDSVRKYLGPAGVYVHSDEDGWTISGCLLRQSGASDGSD